MQVLALLLILVGFFTKHGGFFVAIGSVKQWRVLSRSIPIACCLVILTIQLIFCGDSAPKGIYLTFPTAMLFGLGFILATYAVASLLLFLLEFPLLRLGQLCFLKYLSHNTLLENWHEHMVEVRNNEVESQKLMENFSKKLPLPKGSLA